MLRRFRIALAFVVTLTAGPLAAQPAAVGDPDIFSAEVVKLIAQNKTNEAAKLIVGRIGQPGAVDALRSGLQLLDGKTFDFTKKVIDKDFNDALRQIVIYAHVKEIGFIYFRFNYKMSSAGWLLANFNYKSEVTELFPKDFIER